MKYSIMFNDEIFYTIIIYQSNFTLINTVLRSRMMNEDKRWITKD